MIKVMSMGSRKRAMSWLTLVILMLTLVLPIEHAQAASVTSLSDVMSRLKESTASNHEIKFVTPTGVASGQNIILTFTGFGTVTNLVHTDIDFAEGDSGNCSTASFTEKTLGASASGATWSADGDTASTITITSGTGTVTAGRCVRIRLGTNATSQATGSNVITSGTAATAHSIAVSGTFTDTGSLSIDIISDDQVAVSATVDPTITFTISDNTIGFGSLSASAARWANGAATGSATDTSAHDLTVATNAASGYVLSYNGATLTGSAGTIDVASITNDADGTQGTEQFGLGVSTNGSSTVAAAYDHNSTPSNRDWAFVAGTTTTLVSRTSPTNTETISAFYLANIAGSTEAGSYGTTITYIATGTF